MLASVLANDTFSGATATLALVKVAQISSTDAGVMLNPADGSVSVAAGTAAGTYVLRDRICELASVTNCDRATVTLDLSGGDCEVHASEPRYPSALAPVSAVRE